MNLDNNISRAKDEIISDIMRRRVSPDVQTFGELFDFVDANEYGGLTDYTFSLGEINAVQGALNAWIQSPEFQEAIDVARVKEDERRASPDLPIR